MAQEIVARFKHLCQIPHCSFDTSQMQAYLTEEARRCGAVVQTDEAGNILATKGAPQVCLQAHYDMVCMGDAPHVEVVENNGFLEAKNASLGADNGMGVAMMLAALEECDDLECLFTNDEEVGLLGANALALSLQSPCLLNLDSEEEGKVFVGCAGGVDIAATLPLETQEAPKDALFYEIEVTNLPGGHSGIQIHESIPHAIKVLAQELLAHPCLLVSMEGGERINSIPTAARAIIATKEPFTCKDTRLTCKPVAPAYSNVMVKSDTILKTVCGFAQGVRAWDETLGLPRSSINLSIMTWSQEALRLDFFARSMEEEGLEMLKSETKAFLELSGFAVSFHDETAPWKPRITPFAQLVQETCAAVWGKAEFAGIHAGLECGVLLAKHGGALEVCSIGPHIEAPHTVHERCLVASVGRVYDCVKRIVRRKTYGTH